MAYLVPIEKIKKIFELKANGYNNSQISKELEINRETVGNYLKRNIDEITETRIVESFMPETMSEVQQIYYAYLLGMYLGDGCINKMPHNDTYRIRISLYSNQNDMHEMCKYALNAIFPNNKVNFVQRTKFKININCIDVSCYSNKMVDYFPQHGKGRKHDRAITLTEWQEKLIEKYSAWFITGLFDSDGTQYIQTGSKNTYYSFANKSKDIINLWTKFCNKHDINVTHRTKPDGNMSASICKESERIKFRKLIDDSWEMLDRISK